MTAVPLVSSDRRPPVWREVWEYRELLRSLIVRQLKVKYQRSVLGFIWTLLNPLLTVGILVLVFHYVVKIRVEHYWAFLLSGYFVWNYMLQMLSSGTYVIHEHAALRRSVAFPGEVLLLATAAGRFVEFAIELLIALTALTIVHHQGVPASYVLLPVLLLLQVLLALGFMMPIATLSVFYSDVQHARPIILLMLFYVSPVFYPASMVPEAMRNLYFLNPIAGLLTLFHTVLYEGRFPSLLLLGATVGFTMLLLAVGYHVFNRYKLLFAEIV
jgi:ABC-2 type transport system permease protein